MARPGHFGDSSRLWRERCHELFRELGMSIPYDALTEIRRIRDDHGRKATGGAGNTEWKLIFKILLALKLGIPWRHAYGRKISYLVPQAKGGRDVLENITLSDH